MRMTMHTFKVSRGCLMMVLSRVVHHLVTLLSSSFQTSPRQVTSFTSSAMNTAVVEMNMSPGLVLAYLMLSPSIAFCTVRVTRLMYFRLRLAASFLDLVSDVILTMMLSNNSYLWPGLLQQSFLEYHSPMNTMLHYLDSFKLGTEWLICIF